MHVCMYVYVRCVYVCICLYLHVCVYVCICVRLTAEQGDQVNDCGLV